VAVGEAGDGEQALSAVAAATRQLAVVIALRSIGTVPRVTGFAGGTAPPPRGYVFAPSGTWQPCASRPGAS
jgi:hypothetical protein